MALNKLQRRTRIKMRIRKVVSGTADKPRLSVFRSNKQIYVQLINDLTGSTLLSVTSTDKEIATDVVGKTKVEVAGIVGKLVAKRSIELGVLTISFDRNGYLYHGRVKMLAEAAREGGLKF